MRAIRSSIFFSHLVLALVLRAERLPMRFLTTADGLARDAVHNIVQDRLGVLWFSTSEGVSRYDGEAFRTYRVADGVPGRDVHAILACRDGSVWIATSDGIARFHPEAAHSGKSFVRFRVSPIPGGFDRLMEDHEGAIWAGSYLGLFRFQSSGVYLEPTLFDLIDRNRRSLFRSSFAGMPDPHEPIHSIFEDSARNLWVGTRDGLFLRPGGNALSFTRVLGIAGSTILSIAEGSLGRLWIGTRKGLLSARMDLASGRLTVERVYTVVDGLPDDVIKTLLVTAGGDLWVGTSTGIAKFSPETGQRRRFRSYRISGGLQDGDVESLFEDSNGNIWVSTDGGGAVEITLNGFVSMDASDGFNPAYVGSLSLDREGRPLVLTAVNGSHVVYRSDGLRFSGFKLVGPTGSQPPHWAPWHQVFLESRSRKWWEASYKGLLRFTTPMHGTPSLLKPDFRLGFANLLPDLEVLAASEDSHGALWICTFTGGPRFSKTGGRAGISVLEPGQSKVKTFSESDGLPPLDSFKPVAVLEDRSGQIWVGMHRTGVARFRNGRFEVFTPQEGIPSGGIRQLYQDAAGHLWLASTSGGLGEIDNPASSELAIKVYTTRNGLSSDEIQTVNEDRWGHIYAGTGLGVDQIDTKTGRVHHFAVVDGLAPGEVQDSVRDRNGDLWFGTLTGLSRFTPRPEPPDVPVPTRITGLRVNGREQDIPDEGAVRVSLLDLKPSENNVEIDYAGKPLAGLVTFQYRLLGSGTSEWSTPTRLRSVLYSNLRSGNYHFLVRTVMGRSVPGPSAEVSFRVLPPVWMRAWFLILLATFVVVMAHASHRYHVSHLLEIERMRTRIACDIHDDVGSAISKIIILSEVAQKKSAAESLPILTQVAETGRETLEGMSDLIAAIDPKTDRFGDLIGRMRQFSTESFELAGIDFHLETSDLPLQRRVSPEHLRNIYLIFKECVINVAKHSACKSVGVSIKACQRRFILQISDDGVGFDGSPRPGRNGIANLKQRAATLKGTISWKCEHGTIVVLDIPLPDSVGWRP